MQINTQSSLQNHSCRLYIVIVFICISFSAALAVESVTPRLFIGEGHCRSYFPDDEVRRITALEDVVTPHIAWADSFSTGPVRVLALAHKSFGRWPIELSQRFDFEVNTIYGHAHNQLGAPRIHLSRGLFVQSPVDVEARILQAMNLPIDVVVCDLDFSALTEPIKQRLYELMQSGVGYVGMTEGFDLTGYERDPATENNLIALSLIHI